MKPTTALKIANFLEDVHIFIFMFTFMMALMMGFFLSWDSNSINPLVFCIISAGLIVWCCIFIEKILVMYYKLEDGIYEGYALGEKK